MAYMHGSICLALYVFIYMSGGIWLTCMALHVCLCVYVLRTDTVLESQKRLTLRHDDARSLVPNSVQVASLSLRRAGEGGGGRREGERKRKREAGWEGEWAVGKEGG